MSSLEQLEEKVECLTGLVEKLVRVAETQQLTINEMIKKDHPGFRSTISEEELRKYVEENYRKAGQPPNY